MENVMSLMLITAILALWVRLLDRIPGAESQRAYKKIFRSILRFPAPVPVPVRRRAIDIIRFKKAG